MEGRKTAIEHCDSVEVHVRRPYGSLLIAIGETGMILVRSEDGDGNRIEERIIDPDTLVSDGVADPDSDLGEQLKPLDTVRQELKEAGIGQQPNPFHSEPERQAAGGQKEGGPQATSGDRPESEGRGPEGH